MKVRGPEKVWEAGGWGLPRDPDIRMEEYTEG